MGLFHKAIFALNTLLMLFSIGVVIFASYTIYSFDRETDALFSRGDFALLLLAGLVGLGVAALGCFGSRDPLAHYNLLFCYFFWMSIILVMLCIFFYIYRVFVKNLEASAEGDVANAFRLESAKEFNDLLLSVFVFCCSGCPQSIVTECVRDIEPFQKFQDNCDANDLAAFGSGGTPSCFVPRVCDFDQRGVDEGLGQGCTINSAVVPSYELGDNFCIFFDEFARDNGDNPIVGPADANSCGGGNPKVFVDDVFEFIKKNYYVIATFFGLGMILAFSAWIGTLFMLLCPHMYEDK